MTSEMTAFIVALLAITNPLGNLAIFLGITADKSPAEQKATAIQACVAIAIMLIIVCWVGQDILSAFGISTGAFQVAGGVVIVLIGLSMLHGEDHSKIHHSPQEHEDAKAQSSQGVVPIAMPIVAGPGAITAIILHSPDFPGTMGKVTMSAICLGDALILGLFFFFAGPIKNFIGNAGVKIAGRIMGLVLVSIAFQMIGDGLGKMLPGLL